MTTYNATMESPAEKSYARHQAKLAKAGKREATPADLGILHATLDVCEGLSDDDALTALESKCEALGIDRSHAYDVVFG